jgi:hypothetical protein
MIVLALMTAAALSQGPDFSWSGELGAGKRLSIRNIAGDIRVEATTGSSVSVTGLKRPGRRGDPGDVEIRRVETGDGVTICVVYPGSRGGDGDCDGSGRREGGRWEENDTRVDFTIRLPAGVALGAMTVSGDVTGGGLRGPIEARSVSGDVRLSDVSGPTVEARTVSGDVELAGVGADEVTAETVSGDVEFSGQIRPRGDYDLKTLSGDVVLRIPKDASARIVGSTFSGEFSSSFPITTRATSRYTRQQRIDGTIGDGSARIRVESFSGDVAIRVLEGRN